MNASNLTKSVVDIEKLYGQAKFYDAAKIQLLCITVKEIELFRAFAVVRAALDYATLRKDIKDYDRMHNYLCVPDKSSAGVR